jgi:hypothetical protein
MFDVAPAIAANGTLTFQAKAGVPGSAVVTVRLKDDGGTANGGSDTSIARTFTINNVLSGSIAPPANRLVLEDGTTGPIPFTVTWLNPGSTNRTVTVTSGDTQLLPQANLALVDLGGGNYTVAAAPAADRHGVVRITITATDTGVSTQETFDLTVTPVNDAPSFTVGPNLMVGNDPVEQVVVGAATNMSAGRYDVGQTLSWIVSNDAPSLFAVQPTIDADGALRFTANAGAVGTAVVTIQLRDDGGTADGGVDTSTAKSFFVTLESRGRVTGRIWNDVDRDGLQDGGETGAAGAVVELFSSADGTAGNADDVSLGTARAAADGTYTFNNIAAAANLYVVVHTPPTTAFSPADVGSDDAIDADFAASTGRSSLFSLAAGQTVDLDAGLYGTPEAFGWAFQLGSGQANGTATFEVRKTLLDASGNTYVTGVYSQYGRDLDPGTGVSYLPYADVQSTFIVKLDASGGLVWARTVRNAFNNSAALDGSGNILVHGAYTGTVDFDPGAGTFNMTSPVSSGSAGFLLKLDTAGTFVWAKSVGATRNYDSDVTVTSTGDIVVVGTFNVAADFDPNAGVTSLTPTGQDVYVAKLNQDGSLTWATRFGGTSFTVATSVAVDAVGNIFVGGSFNSTVDFDPGAGVANRSSTGSFTSDAFVVKLSASGTFVWADAFGGANSDVVNDLALTSTGDVVAVGRFIDSIDLDPGAGTNIRTGINSWSDSIFVVKLASGGAHVWGGAVRSGGPSGVGGVMIDAAGNIYIDGRVDAGAVFDAATGADVQGGENAGFLWTLTAAGAHQRLERWVGGAGVAIAGNGSGDYVLAGTVSSTIDFDPGTGTAYVAAPYGSQNYFVARRTAADGHVWARQFGDASSLSVTDMATDSAGDVYAVGRAVGTVDFDPGAGVARNGAGSGTGYLAKYSREGALIWIRYYTLGDFATPKMVIGADGGVTVMQTITYDSALSRFDGQGNLLWSRTFIRASITDLKLDSSGRLVIVGTKNANGDLDPGDGVFNLVNGESFAARFDLGGNLEWANSLGSILPYAVAVADNGDLAITGMFSGTRDFDPGAGTANLTATSGNYDMFVVRLSSAGQFLWVVKYGGTFADAGGDATFDAAGNLLVLGHYGTNSNNHDDLLLKLDAAGNEVWSRRTNANAFAANSTFSKLRLDAAGNIFVAGTFIGSPTFEPGITLPSVGSNDWYVARYDSAGALAWVKSFGYWSGDTIGGLALDGAGNLFVGGTFYGFIEADPGQGYYAFSSDTTTSYSGGVGLITRWNAAYMAPEINVTGNGVGIAAGDDTPAAGDFTDFGIVPVGSPAVTRQFVIANSGNVDLLLNGPFRVEVIGAAAGDFTVSLAPSSRIEMGATSTFDVIFAPTAAGIRNATVVIRSNDGDEPAYSFAVRGATAGFPTVSAIGDQQVDVDGQLNFDFAVDDVNSPAGSLAVTVESSNTTLLPNNRLALAYHGGGNYMLIAQPAAGLSGETLITITVRDSELNTGTRTFLLTVVAAPPPPSQVTGVYARGAAWSGAFTTHLQDKGLTDAAGWLELSRGAGQTDTLPWSNVNQLLVKFANLPALAAGQLQIVAGSGVSLPNYTVAFNAGTQTALVSFDQALPMGKFLIWIDDAVGNFDGEWTDNVSTASGNGTAGGDFAFRFNVLPGDFDRSQSVAFGEIGQQRNMIGRTTASGDYNYRQDYDGSGSISFGDYGQARNNVGLAIGTMADPTLPTMGDSNPLGPESYGPESFGPESYTRADSGPDSHGPAVVESAPSAADPANTAEVFVVTTFNTATLFYSAGDDAAPPPVVVPSTNATLSHRDLARAWSVTASLPVATVLGRAQIAAPAMVRTLATDNRFAAVVSNEIIDDLQSAIVGRALIDPVQLPHNPVRWSRLRRSEPAAPLSDGWARVAGFGAGNPLTDVE